MTSTYQTDISIREKIAESLEVDIDDKCEAEGDRWHSRRLGSSQIGISCSRQIWYAFRWSKMEKLGSPTRPAGRVLRLFGRGHLEEPLLIKHLQDIGCTFKPEEDGKQSTYETCNGHAVTKIDGLGFLPMKYGVNEEILFEFKTANMNNFNKMRKKGIQTEVPKYWAQANFSAYLAGVNYIVFVVVCKNDDDILIEFHKADHEYGQMLESKAMSIITTREPPAKIAQSATNFACKFCAFVDICHHDEPVEKSCRSCQHAVAAAEGKWACCNPSFEGCAEGMEIPLEVIPNGCDYHLGID